MNKFDVFGLRPGNSEPTKHTIIAPDQVEAWAKFRRAYPAEEVVYKGAKPIRASSAPRDLELRAERRDRIRAALPESEFTAGDFMFRDMTTRQIGAALAQLEAEGLVKRIVRGNHSRPNVWVRA